MGLFRQPLREKGVAYHGEKLGGGQVLAGGIGAVLHALHPALVVGGADILGGPVFLGHVGEKGRAGDCAGQQSESEKKGAKTFHFNLPPVFE